MSFGRSGRGPAVKGLHRHVDMKAALYLRVSTDEEAREGYSIPAQRDRLLAFAQAQDWSGTVSEPTSASRHPIDGGVRLTQR